MYLTSITTMTSGSWGSVFDGRFVYLISQYTGLIIAHDATRPFTTVNSYTTFTLTSITAYLTSYTNAIYDGNYIYLGTRAKTLYTRINQLKQTTNYIKTSYDVKLTNFSDGQLLVYQSAISKWINSSTITAEKLKTATGTVTISSATAPSAGQASSATSSTTAIWQNQSINTSVLGSLNITFMTSSYATAKVFTGSYHINPYVVDCNTITETGYYFDLPTSGVTNLQKKLCCKCKHKPFIRGYYS